jgi:hypothetical protein
MEVKLEFKGADLVDDQGRVPDFITREGDGTIVINGAFWKDQVRFSGERHIKVQILNDVPKGTKLRIGKGSDRYTLFLEFNGDIKDKAQIEREGDIFIDGDIGNDVKLYAKEDGEIVGGKVGQRCELKARAIIVSDVDQSSKLESNGGDIVIRAVQPYTEGNVASVTLHTIGGNVHVEGSVKESTLISEPVVLGEYTVGGGIIVEKDVEASKLDAKGSIEISGAVTGKSELHAEGGDIRAGDVTDSKLTALGGIIEAGNIRGPSVLKSLSIPGGPRPIGFERKIRIKSTGPEASFEATTLISETKIPQEVRGISTVRNYVDPALGKGR